MARKTYWEKLRDPRWQRKRLEVLGAAEFTCMSCLATDKTLNVHHKLYRKGADPWNYADHELEVLCEDCHENQHHWRTLLDECLARLDGGDIEVILGFAEGRYAVNRMCTDEEDATPGLYPIRSHGHAWGFNAAMMASCSPEETESLIEMQPITASEIFGMNAHGARPSQLIEHRKKTRGSDT